MTMAQSMLEEFEQEQATTRRFLERIPDDKLDWRPHEKSMTAGQLALHIADVPAGVLKMAMQDEGVPPNFTELEKPANLPQVLDRFEASVATVRELLPTLDDTRMQATFRMVGQDGTPLLAMPRVVFLRSIMLNHWYHHRGQLGVYLRLLGASVPAAYGPSGDEYPPHS